VAGVCAGVAEYFTVDPIIVRIAAVVLALSGPGVIAYVLAWIFVPAADDDVPPPTAHRGEDRSDRGAQVFGIVLLAIAVSVLWGDWWSPARDWMLPFGLMALGAWLLLRRDDGPAVAGPGSTPSVASAAAPTPTSSGSPTDPTATDPTATDPMTTDPMSAEPVSAADSTSIDPTSVGPWPTAPWPASAADAARIDWSAPSTVGDGAARRRRRMVGPIVMGALLIWSGTAWLIGTPVETALAVALCILGIGFVLGAFVGGGWGLVVPAVAIGAALIVASTVDIPLSGPVGDITWAPDRPSAVEERYELSVGEGTLDLTGLALRGDDHLEVEAAVGIGHLVIEVPADATLIVSADVAAGEVMLLGTSDSGLTVSTERAFRGVDGEGTIELDLEVGLGQIEVRRGGVPIPVGIPR